jgi:hypothetical protein
MMKTLNTPAAQLVGGLLLGAVVFVAFAVGQDLGSGLVSGGLVIAFVVATSTPARPRSPARSWPSCCRSGGS